MFPFMMVIFVLPSKLGSANFHENASARFARNQRERLREALDKGNVEATRALIAEGVDLMTQFEDSETPLHIASLKSKDMLKLLLSKKVHLEAKNKMGITAFQFAIMCGRMDTAGILLEAGADINSVDIYGHTTLHGKVSEGLIIRVEWLLHNGASLYPVDVEGQNAFDIALSCRWSETGRILIEYGADISPPKYDPMKIYEKYWKSCFIIPQNHLDDFDKYVAFVTNAFLTGQSEDKHDNTLSVYAKNHVFALYRILKETYPKERMKGIPSRLERARVIFFDIFVTRITEKTYFEMVPVEMTSEVLLLSERIFWRIERISFHLALISVNYNYLDVSKAFTRDEIMHFIKYYIQ